MIAVGLIMLWLLCSVAADARRNGASWPAVVVAVLVTQALAWGVAALLLWVPWP